MSLRWHVRDGRRVLAGNMSFVPGVAKLRTSHHLACWLSRELRYAEEELGLLVGVLLASTHCRWPAVVGSVLAGGFRSRAARLCRDATPFTCVRPRSRNALSRLMSNRPEPSGPVRATTSGSLMVLSSVQASS